MALTLANGILINAVRKKIVANNSKNDLIEIKGKILKHLRSRKTIVYKMRPKKKTRRKQGHRQDLTRVLIKEININ